jgi:hypothetical protein
VREVAGERAEPDVVIERPGGGVRRCAEAGDEHLGGASLGRALHSVLEQGPGQPLAPVALMGADRLELGGAVALVQPHDRSGGQRAVRRPYQHVQVGPVGPGLAGAAHAAVGEGGRMPGVPVRLRRLLGRDLLGGDEAESGRQRGFGQVAQLAPVELGPEAVVARGLLVYLVAVRGQPAQRVAVRGRDGDLVHGTRRLGVVPVQDVVQQVRGVRVNLPRQAGLRDVQHLPVAAHHLVRQAGPAPAGQVAAGEPQPVPPGAAEVGVILAPSPGQLADGGVAVHQFRPQRRDLLGQALHEAQVRRPELCLRHDGSVPHARR